MKYKDLSTGQIGALEIMLPLKHYFTDGAYSLDGLKRVLEFAASSWRLDNEEKQELRRIFLEGDLMRLNTQKECNEYLRFNEYLRTNNEYSEQEDLSNIVRVFCEVYAKIRIASREHSRLSSKNVIEQLHRQCDIGDIYALKCVGLIYLFGIEVPKNIARAKAFLLAAAQWNDLPAILMMAQFYRKSLNHEQSYVCNKVFCELAKTKGLYSCTAKISKDVTDFEATATQQIIDEAKRHAKIHAYLAHSLALYGHKEHFSPERFNADAVRVIYSDKVRLTEIVKLLETPDTALWRDISNLIQAEKCGALREVAFPIENRKNEERIIKNYFHERQTRKGVKPLLIAVDDDALKQRLLKYVQDMSVDLISKRIDARSVPEERISRQSHKHNVIATTMESRSRTNFVLVLDNLETVNIETKRYFAEILNPKSTYYLTSLGISLDVSKIIKVAFCKKLQKVDDALVSMCDVLEIKELSDLEKNCMLEQKICSLNDDYNIDKESQARIKEILFKIEKLEDAELLLSKALRESEYVDDKPVGLDLLLERYLKDIQPKRLGFGND